MTDKAVLWDVNGVIIDDMRVHFVSDREVLGELGCEVTDEYLLATTVGTPPREFFSAILPTIGNHISNEEVLERKQESYLRLIKDLLQSPPGVRELMEDQAGRLQAGRGIRYHARRSRGHNRRLWSARLL